MAPRRWIEHRTTPLTAERSTSELTRNKNQKPLNLSARGLESYYGNPTLAKRTMTERLISRRWRTECGLELHTTRILRQIESFVKLNLVGLLRFELRLELLLR